MKTIYTKKFLALISFFLLMQVFSYAQTWNGSLTTDWNTPANWNGGVVPSATGDVVIPMGQPRYPKLASNVTINTINMQTGSQLDVNGFTLTITTVLRERMITIITMHYHLTE